MCTHHIFIHSSVYWHLGASMLWLSWIVLLWTLGSMDLFNLEFSSLLDICPGVGLLDDMLVLFLELFSRVSAQSCPTLRDPRNCSPSDCSVHGDSPGKNTWACCHALLQRIFPTQGLNWTSVSWVSCIGRQILYQWATWGAQLVFQGTSRLFSILAAPVSCIFLIFLPFYIQGLCSYHWNFICAPGRDYMGRGREERNR